MLTGGSPQGDSRTARILALVVSVIVPLAVGGIGGAITADAIPGWYAGLAKPAWNPPPWLFGPVWSALYVAMGVAAWLIWNRRTSARPLTTQPAAVRGALIAYAVQLVLNGAWSPVFFGWKRIDLALVVIVLLLAAIAETLRRFYRIDRAAAWLLFPYLAWVSFATLLNGSIWVLNR